MFPWPSLPLPRGGTHPDTRPPSPLTSFAYSLRHPFHVHDVPWSLAPGRSLRMGVAVVLALPWGSPCPLDGDSPPMWGVDCFGNL